MKKRILLLSIVIAGNMTLFGQDINTGIVDQKMLPNPSGEANNSIGNLFSPSLFDGSANINIPIYNFQNDFGSFGISLSYNTKGVTVDEMSGPVGTHFSLNCGGFITRTVRDLPDETDMQITTGIVGQINLMGRQKVYLQSSKTSSDYWDNMNDDYTVSAGNLNFSFKIGKNGYIYSYPESRAKIIKTIPIPNNPTDYGYKITDVDGTQYDFTVSDHQTQSISNGNFANGGVNSQTLYDYISKWKLSKITFPNGQVITFNYSETWYSNDLYIYSFIGHKEGKNSSGVPYTSSIPYSFVTGGGLGGYSFALDSINYPNNTTASFIYDQNPTNGAGCSKSVKQIKVAQGANCSKFVFTKEYLAHGPSNYLQEIPFDNSCNYNRDSRLVLKSINITNCDETLTEPYYSFEYSSTPPSNRSCEKRDFFGYPNGVGVSTSTVSFPLWPTHNHPFSGASVPGDNRNVATVVDSITPLCLTKVYNAYGGSMTFKYESHVLTNVLTGLPTTDPLFVGLNATDGLRIKSITTEDKYYPGNSSITTYTYSGGQFFLNGGYYSYPSSIDANGVINEYTINNNWISPHQLVNGSNHGYSNVTVETKDNLGNSLSKTAYQFTNFKDGNNLRYQLNGSFKHYYQAPYTDKQYLRDWEFGLPTVITNYDQNGNIVKRTTNYYNSIQLDQTTISNGLGLNVNFMKKAVPTYVSGVQNVNILTLPIIAADTFVPYSGKSQLDTTIVETFINDNLSLKDTGIYTYDTRGNLSTSTRRNSKGELFISKNIYNYSVIENGNLGSLPSTNPLQTLFNDGIEEVVSTENWKKVGTGLNAQYNDLLYNATINVYAYQNSKIWVQKSYVLRSLLPVTYTGYTGMSMGGPILNPYGMVLNSYNNIDPTSFQLMTNVLSVDANNNPTETQITGTDAYKAMIWDISTGNKLAESNCRLNEMAFSSFETSTKGNWNYDQTGVVLAAGNGGAIDGSMILAVNGVSQPLSILGLTPNKEYTLTFWCKGSLPVISGGGLTNITYSTEPAAVDPSGTGWIFYVAHFIPTNNSIIGIKPNGAFNTSYIDDARIFPSGFKMNSWTYTPKYGIGSSIDPSGRITYYEYDSFGRQSVIRNQEGKILSKQEYTVGQ